MEWANGMTSSLPIEVANLLAPGRTFNDKKVQTESIHERKIITIQSLSYVDKSSEHYRYVYQTDMGLMSFSAFELARTLFFHNSHLTRAAYSPSNIAGLAFVDRTSNPIKIKFPDSTSYPVSSLITKHARIHFAWLMMTKQARKSAFTIFQTFKDNADSVGFQFEPPDLAGWQIDVSLSEKSTKEFQIERIENIVEALVEEELDDIKIHHPTKKYLSSEVGRKKTSVKGVYPDVDIDPELDLEEVVGFGKRHHKQRIKGFSFKTSRITEVTLTKGKEKAASGVMPTDDTKVAPEKAGVGTPEREGTSQEYDPVINQDDEPVEDSAKEAVDLPQKFLIFEEVVKEIGKLKGVDLKSVKCYFFPDPESNSNVVYQTKYNTILKFFMASIKIGNSNLIIIEADTTSLIKPKGSSTLILGLKDNATTNYREIIQNFSDKGARWNHGYIQERCETFVPCRHPTLKVDKAVRTNEQYKDKWVSDIKEHLRKIALAASTENK